MIFVRSERAATRVLGSVSAFIESRLKLKVNQEKSKVSSVFKVSLLGFGYYRPGGKGEVRIRIDRKAVKRLKAEVRRLTSRSWGVSMVRKLGYAFPDGERIIGGRHKWRASRTHAMSIALDNAYWDDQGYKSFEGLYSRLRTA